MRLTYYPAVSRRIDLVGVITFRTTEMRLAWVSFHTAGAEVSDLSDGKPESASCRSGCFDGAPISAGYFPRSADLH